MLLTWEGAGTGSPTWYMTDERLSVIARVNGSGALISGGINSYDEYGVPASGMVTGSANRFQYTGQVRLPGDLYHYRARAYEPTLGRFLQPDPIGYQAGLNLYAYVGADPVNRVDRLGLQEEPTDLGEIIVTGGRACPMGQVRVADWVCIDRGGLPMGADIGIGAGGSAHGGGGRLSSVSQEGRANRRLHCIAFFVAPHVGGLANHRGGLPPFSWNQNSVTIGNTIYFDDEMYSHLMSEVTLTTRDAQHVFHEYKHIGQYRSGRLTVIGAILSYARHGYYNAWFEVEARSFAGGMARDFNESGAADECGVEYTQPYND